jgi:SPP1 gp7 family putative phage head morphogenesis protein
MKLTREQLLAIDNLAILTKAKHDGLLITEMDLMVNYAEIDHTLNDLEGSWQKRATDRMWLHFKTWLQQISDKEDLDPKEMDLKLQPLLLEFIKSIWGYGQQTADQEVQAIETASFAEGGKPDLTDLTNTDAFEWYSLYTRELAKQGSDAAFTYMQPLILEKLEAGTVRLELADALEKDFRRYGMVRTGIIARTESNKAFNWGRRYRFDKSAAIAGYRYSAILDERTTEICQFLHGHSWEIGDPELNANTPPNHYQCRSILVAISKYVSFNFDPPSTGWEAGLPDKERIVYEKFRDSTFYPKADTVIQKAAPVMAKPKMKAKKKAAAKKAPAPPKDDLSHLSLDPDDLAAIERFDDLLKGVDLSQDRRKIAKGLLKGAGLDHLKVSIRKIKSLGRVKYYDKPVINTVEFALDSQDGRDEIHQLRTVFHEFYHANYHGLEHDYKGKYDIGPELTREEWLRWEETATEAAAHFMLKRAGKGSGTAPSYSNYMAKTLPLLKKLPEFSDCVTVEDFGAKFMKFRFSDKRSAKWKEIQDKVEPFEKGFEWKDYWRQYEETVMENEEAFAGLIYDTYSSMTKEKHREWYFTTIKEGIKRGWERLRNTKGDMFTQSLLAAMQKDGVR